ncbi:hypothetical protein PSPO01_14743 [Paraphaeosphaeria sporulosa]
MAPFTSSHDEEVRGLNYFPPGHQSEDSGSGTDEVASVNVGASHAPHLQHLAPTEHTVDLGQGCPYCYPALSTALYQPEHAVEPCQRQTWMEEKLISPDSTNLATGIGGFQVRGDCWIPETIPEPPYFIFPRMSATSRGIPNSYQGSFMSDENSSPSTCGYNPQMRSKKTSSQLNTFPPGARSA